MVAEANYGGRVTDPMDRRLIKIILLDFYTSKIIDEDDYAFSPSRLYFAPPVGTIEDFKIYAQALPLNDQTEIFGLHQNAEISKAIIETNQICDTILSLLPRSSNALCSLAKFY